jgi:dynactin complex subunit
LNLSLSRREKMNILWKQSLDDQEWYLTLEMSISRTTPVERERERAHLQNNIKTKPEQLKLSKTYVSTWA